MAEVLYSVVLDFQAKGLNNLKAQANKAVTQVTKGFDNLYQKSVNNEIFKNYAFQNLDPKVFGFGAREMDSFFTSTEKASVSLKTMQNTFSKIMQVERLREMGVDAQFLDIQLMGIAKDSQVGAKNFYAMQQQAQKMSRRFDMGLLSMMFFGMQIQKTFTGIYNSMLNTFKMLDKKGIMPLNRAMTKMEAAFTFLSFSIMKSMEPILLPIIDAIVGVIDWFSQLPEPVLQAMGVFVLFGLALGTVMVLIGTFGLGLGGIESFMVGLGKFIPPATKALNTFASSSAFNLIGSLAGTLIIATAAWLVFTAALEGYSKHKDEVDSALDNLSISFWNLIDTITLGMLELPKSSDLWDTFWNLLTTGATGSIIIIAQAVSNLTDLIDILINTATIIPEGLFSLLTGGDISKNKSLENIGADVEKILSSSNQAWNDLMRIGAEDSAELFDTTMSKKMAETNAKAPEYSSDFIKQYSLGIDENSVILNDTTTEVFTESGNIMKEIVHNDVNTVIADVNRALAKLRELENARKAASTKASTSTITNNKSIVVNVKGSDNTKLVSDIKRAVA